MTGVQEEIPCRLCLKTVIVKSFEVIENVIRDILDVLLLKLKFDDESKDVICNVCRRKLYAAFEFKSTCLNTDSTIIPHVDCEKMLQLDIREVYRKEKRNESISDGRKICRLCMNLVKSEFRCICEEELEAIEKLAPEMNINIIKDPVVCKECFDSLCTHNSFLRECLEVEEKIRGLYDNSTTESRIDTLPSEVFIKIEKLDKEFDVSEMEMSVKTECVDIKSEDGERSDALLQSSHNESFQKSYCKDAEKDGCKLEYGSANKCNMQAKQKRNVLYRCDKSIYKTGSEIRSRAHCGRHKKDSEVYKCQTCQFETENKKLLQRHQLRHKDPSHVQKYKCNDCDFETKYKGYIKRHQMKHKDPSQVQMYKCKDCDYETKYKECIKKHQLIHKDPSQVQIYRCNDCNFQTKYKGDIRRHLLKHRDPSQVQMYKCNDCNYKTAHKNHIKQHELKHKDPSQVQMFRCTDCSYKTKHSKHIKRHQLKHKDHSQVQMYRCNDCDYKSKYKSAVKRHLLQHKGILQVQMYRCSDCNYETKYKSGIKYHVLKHKEHS
ncbi:zinc finger Y-chromosomal protein-like [Anoplophora glabripennis]|uniref:zinc finger Y-chromosomal protein-like n=1 Tax=Anoplophora glabripennis TaxID=217634 RepID=UPI000874BFDD|nr:zinc finger Y-chromosomal protein-like [Anoplophora glabripennis]